VLPAVPVGSLIAVDRWVAPATAAGLGVNLVAVRDVLDGVTPQHPAPVVSAVGPRHWRAARRVADAVVALLCLGVVSPLAASFAFADSPWGAGLNPRPVPGGWLGAVVAGVTAVWTASIGLRHAATVVRPQTLDLDRDGLVHRTLFGGETRARWDMCGQFRVSARTWPGDGDADDDMPLKRQIVLCPTQTLEPPHGIRARIIRACHPRQSPIVAPFRPGDGPWGLNASDLAMLLDRYRRTYGQRP
jgi:hypothetical protein